MVTGSDLLADEPDNAHTVFYLAQTYADLAETDLVVDMYRRRVPPGECPSTGHSRSWNPNRDEAHQFRPKLF